MARPIAQDHDDKRRHILKTAAVVFARDGVARASMTAVARDSGISKANIYHYYASKDALVFAILDTYLSALRDRVCDLDLAGLEAADALERMLLEILRAYDGMDAEHKMQTEGVALLPADQQAVLKAYQRDMVRALSGVLARLAPEVFAGDAAKLRAATMSVFGMLNWFYMWNRDAGSEARDAYARLVARMAIGGVAAV